MEGFYPETDTYLLLIEKKYLVNIIDYCINSVALCPNVDMLLYLFSIMTHI